MKIIDLVQGSDEWCAYRSRYFTASEASIMMACSKNVKRNELLHMKATGSEQEFSAWFQKNVLEKGHRIEAAARPIAERIVGEELYPVTAVSDDGTLLASFDGITMLEDVGWECKQWNASKAEEVRAGEVPQEDYWQVVQQLVVSGADQWLYMVTDGTEENTVSTWVALDDFHASQLVAGWEQFSADLEAYQPTEQTVAPQGEAPEALPALKIDLTGAVQASNLPDFKARAMGMIEGIRTKLTTDQHFADAAETVKFLQKGEKQLEASKKAALEQTASISELFSTIDELRETMRQKRLHLDKLVKAEKENRRLEIQQKAHQAFDDFLAKLDCPVEPRHSLNVAGAMKGKKTIATLQSAADDEVARAKVECQQLANQISENKALIEKHQGDYGFLFSDWRDLIQRDAEFIKLQVENRIAHHKQEEQKRLEAEREKIRHEEEAKAKAANKEAIDKSIAAGTDEPATEERRPLDTSKIAAAAERGAALKPAREVEQPDTVTISCKEYEALLAARDKLDALEAAGVYNWSGYDDALEHLRAA
ncbi:YqaJ viral recombinase family protein [Halomonas sp.]|uniref:YqaJ viral recombinase family protein n=1 Tax=Halomonas sp. TaxID=1486246 RepID=UPI000C91D315|nr:YqaJ viral recombinase family protein [Halomonas sp.]MAR70745.1 Heme peroxidase [Halomonas sp.]|tara:strand:+ start:1665 stop:3278 length:1614 start_codon:yes stop_codon:yes gene_type:complete